MLGTLNSHLFKLCCCRAYLLVQLLELDPHADPALYEFTHVIVEHWKVKKIWAELPENARVEIVLDIVLPILLTIVDAKDCVLAMW